MVNIKRWLSRWRKNASSGSDYAARVANEIRTFENDTDVHHLPEIFHYWSNKYLRPKLEQFGLTDPENFFFEYCRKAGRDDRAVRIASVGAGNCDMESRLAQRLKEIGWQQFSIACIDINPSMLKRGRELAAELGVEEHIVPTQGDFNNWQPRAGEFDVVIANQSLHHVTNLEGLFDAIRHSLQPAGYFLTSDMIGRNGHQRWPEALEAMVPFWDELPPPYRYNQVMRRQEDEFINFDCYTEGFEGIRAQDILPLLTERFHFALFIPFANIVNPFIDRCFGHNFDAAGEWDQAFIDRVHAADEEGMRTGSLKPTQMIAALQVEETETLLPDPQMTPHFCVRDPERRPEPGAS